MGIAEKLDEFIRNNDSNVFIEAEAKPSRLQSFYKEYNRNYSPTVDDDTDGIIVLQEDANKWGLELRLYMHCNPHFIQVTKTAGYRGEYAYRINDKDVIQELFNLGYRIGLN